MYRLYVIFKLPCLKVLDFQKVTAQERLEANAIFTKVENLDQVKKTDLMIGTTISQALKDGVELDQEKIIMEADLDMEDK